MPFFSIIMPVYNRGKLVDRSIQSLRAQIFRDIEIICVDDGSKDNSLEVLYEFARKDDRIKVIHQENGGVAKARNTGMQYATGKYIMFLDSDDFIHPQTMEIAYDVIEKNKSDIASFSYDRFYRPQLMVRHFLHLDTDNVMPIGMKKRYNLNNIKTKTVDDVFELATERTHNKTNPNRKWLIKHCQVWKNIYKKQV